MTLTVAGNKPSTSMAKRPTSIRGINNRKTATKTQNLNSRVVVSPPARCPPMLPSRSTSPAAGDLSSFTRGTPEIRPADARGGMSTAAPIALQAPLSSIHSIGTTDCINCSMNIVRAKPEPYLEPIKLLNKQSIEDRQQNPVTARFHIGSVPFEKTLALKQQSPTTRRSCYTTGDRFPSASSRPIPPPRVLLRRHQSAREEIRRYRPSEKKVTNKTLQQLEEEKSAVKKRELAYLIVDLQTGQSAISTAKNKRTIDDSDVGLKTRKQHSSTAEKSSRCPVRSFTMSIPGDQVKRPVVKPQLKPKPSKNTSLDSHKGGFQQLSTDGIATIPETTISSSGEHSPEPPVTMETDRSHDQHHVPHPTRGDLLRGRPEICVSTSTGDDEDEDADDRSALAPPPLPPKRGINKMTSLPAVSPSAGKRLQRDGGTSLPASYITKDLQQVHSPRADSEGFLSSSSTEKTSSGNHTKPAKSRLPPPKPRPYSERVLSPPPPPSFPPPPRPVTSPVSQPTSPPESRRMASPVPPPKSSKSPPLSPTLGTRLSPSNQSLIPPGTPPIQASRGTSPRNRIFSDSNSRFGKPKPPKPPPPSRPPPPNSKLSQLIAEHRHRSKSTLSNVKGSPPTTANTSRVKPSISEPRLISTTMKSDSQSLTDLRVIQPEPETEDIDLIPLSNISYVSSVELQGNEEDRPSPLYEDIDSLIPLSPSGNEVQNMSTAAAHPPIGKKSSSAESAPPELPPKNCYLDHRGRRIVKASPPPLPAKSPLLKTLSSNSSNATQTDRHLSSPDSLTDKEPKEGDKEESGDWSEPYCIKKVNLSDDEEERERERWTAKEERQDIGAHEPVKSSLSIGAEGPLQEPDVGGVDEYITMGSVINGAWETDDSENVKTKTRDRHFEESYVEMQPVALGNPDSPSPVLQDVSRNAYELDDEPDREPVYIEMNPEEFLPPNKLYYASKDLLSHRPDLQAKKKKSKKIFHIGKK